MSEQKQLAVIVKESGLPQSKAQVILDNFTTYFDIAADWERKAAHLTVTDSSQIAEMKMAREGRLFLRQKRIDVENARKALKADVLREGQTIDAIAKILKNLIEPIEEDLHKKEKFAEIQEAARIERLHSERLLEIEPYAEYAPELHYGKLSDEEYGKLLSGAKAQHEAVIEAERKAEEERVAREKAEAEERERIRKENERLKAEAEAREKEIEKQRKAEALERAKAEAEAKAEREAAEAKLKAEQDAAKKAAEKAAAEKAKLEAKIKAKEDAEKKAKAKAEADAKKLAAAPDKKKLTSLAKSIKDLPLPDVSSDEAKKIISDVSILLSKVVKHINENAGKL